MGGEVGLEHGLPEPLRVVGVQLEQPDAVDRAGGAEGVAEELEKKVVRQIALLAGREARNGKATAYVCRSYACEEPATTPAVLASQLEKAGAVATTNY